MNVKTQKTNYATELLPTDWQNVIFINYGKVRTDILASVLRTDEKTVIAEAERMGLGKIRYDDNWRKCGYVTTIRNNWHLLSYKQIAALLEMTDDELEYILFHEDFLFIKLGQIKPDTGEVYYFPLTAEQRAATDKVCKLVLHEYIEPTCRPFDFFANTQKSCIAPVSSLGETVIYNYCSRYGDILLDGDFGAFSDELLAAYSSCGVTGIWFEGLLSRLANHPFGGGDGKQLIRQKNLRTLCEKCAAYGIRIFLYFNEPRAMKTQLMPEKLRGNTDEDGYSALCISTPEVREYLISATEELCRAVPKLGGIITITMSENFTHCGSRKGPLNCPRCKAAGAPKLAATVNNLIAEGARRAGGNVRVIANLWGWSAFCGWDDAMQHEGISALDKDVEVLIVSEYGKDIEKGGVKCTVIDYSISNIGPAKSNVELLKFAEAKGHKVWAKIQINTSWECSAVPCIPAYNLVAEHLNNLATLGITDFMGSWTLGGYPSSTLKLSSTYRGKNGVDYDGFLKGEFGEHAKAVKNTVDKFSSAFREFPFSVDVLYYAPHNLGGGEMWSSELIDLPSTMVGFSYDDTETYTVPYGEKIYISQMRKVVNGFKEAAADLSKISADGNSFSELRLGVNGALLQYEAALNHVEFTIEKKAGFPNKEKALEILDREYDCVRRLYSLISSDARMGFEATQHYYYNENTLLLKLINLTVIREKISC